MSSIKNPKLFDLAEEAIRRLILPEITKLKRGQPSQQSFHEFELNNQIDSGVDSSLPSNFELSPRRISGDQYSCQSGSSTSSTDNPELIDTVEEAIRRIVLPEIMQLKREQNCSKIVTSSSGTVERSLGQAMARNI